MGKLEFRNLEANEIECRISNIKANGIILLLYKDARVDQNLLDETVGPMNWSRSHETIDGRLYCTVSIYDEEKDMWVPKQDVGKESYTEKEKGQASDSFKRACFNWGIGRELYTAPFIWIPADKCEIKTEEFMGKNKFVCYDKFEVEQIIYQENAIVALSIRNISRKQRVFVFDNRKKQEGVA